MGVGDRPKSHITQYPNSQLSQITQSPITQSPMLFLRRPDSQFIQQPVVLTPLLPDGDSQVEEKLPAEKALDLFARSGADLLDHLSATADDDRLLRFSFDENGEIEAKHLPFLFLPSVEQYGG